MTQYELVYKVYNENIEEITYRIKNSKFPTTFKILGNFLSKIQDLENGLEKLHIDNNFYTSQCLIRVLYEHYLVAYYIWTRCRVEVTDDCAIDYEQYYAIYEMIKQENYNAKLDKTYDPKQTPLQNFLIKAPEFNVPEDPLTEDNVLDINKRANKFDIRYILRYLMEELDANDHFQSLHFLMLDVCKKYNKASSYVHGGRMAELEAFENTPPVDKIKIMKDNLSFAKIYSYQIADFIMMLLLSEDTSFIKTYQPIYDFLQAQEKK
jgi:hypothetical protein